MKRRHPKDVTFDFERLAAGLAYQETIGEAVCSGCGQECHPNVHCSEVATRSQIARATLKRDQWVNGYLAGLKETEARAHRLVMREKAQLRAEAKCAKIIEDAKKRRT